jgi:4-diphosphocytidyl-2-C-methyl-D-erythritol kinase
MKFISIKAPAKINLSLKVLAKRGDGFHEVNLLMTKIHGLADEISIEESDVFSFECSDSTLPVNETNLVIKATRLFEQLAQVKCTGKIKLTKKIPHGAGLGGGSSDAAATLRAWNQWLNNPLTEKVLVEKSAILGSDIPFFLGTDTARCTGRGEVIQKVDYLPQLSIILLKPSFSVATFDAYRLWDKSNQVPTTAGNLNQFTLTDLINDLEAPVFGKHPFLAEMKLWLNSRMKIQKAMMT